MQTLTVVNQMLASMGEVELASLTDTHPFLPSALSTLDNQNRNIQSKPWWFNEETVTLEVNPIDNSIYLPGDTLEIITCNPNYVQRGSRLYNKDGGTYEFDLAQTVTLRRLLDFEDLPELAAQYIAAEAVLRFQSNYDSDGTKRQELMTVRDDARITLNAEETRQRKVNRLINNPRLARLKRHFSRGNFSITGRVV